MKIIGTGGVLPKKIITNHDLTDFLDTSDEWIVSRTGIKQRHVITDETLKDLSGEAARRALEDANLSADSLDLIICSTVLGEYITPSLSCMIQGKIGANCPCFDINVACTGFIYALDMADAYMKAGKAKNILIVCGECMSRITDWTDRGTCILFGDGASAVVVQRDEQPFIAHLTADCDDTNIYATPDSGNCPFRKRTVASGIKMQGQEVFKFAVSASISDLREISRMTGIDLADVDYFLLHQANERIVRSIQHRLGIEDEKMVYNIQNTANISSATIPLMLDRLNRSGGLKNGDTLAMSAFGAGMTTGACIMRWDKEAI